MYEMTDTKLEHIVAAANMAGYMEAHNEIYVCNDEELTAFILREYDEYSAAVESEWNSNQYDCYDEHKELPVWTDWIHGALVQTFAVRNSR